MSFDIIRACQPCADKHVYVLGGVSWRVSLHTQQRRALDLVDAVKGQLDAGGSVAVIGGGVAGVTCAATLAHNGFEVSIYERSGELLSLQKKNTTRFLHPNTVTWPYSDLPCCTDLPFLNWHSDYSDAVASLIEEEFDSDFVGREHEGVELFLNTHATGIEEKPEGFLIEGHGPDGKSEESFDAVFLTTGFNRERKVSGYDRFSYWEDTSPIPITGGLALPKVAIIGDGDGALVELIRCSWPAANTDELYRFVVDKFVKPGWAEKIRNAEEDARRIYGEKPDVAHTNLKKVYTGDVLTAQGKRFLRSRLKKVADITIISMYSTPFSPKSSPVHKVIMGFLLKEKHIEFLQREVETVDFRDERYFVCGKSAGTFGEDGPFDRVLERLGPERGFCALVQNFFEDAVLEKFELDNGAEFDFSNSIKTDCYPPELQCNGPLSEDTPLDRAYRKLTHYFRSNYPSRVANIGISQDQDQKAVFTVSCHDENLKKDGPQVYLGYKLCYERAQDAMQVI